MTKKQRTAHIQLLFAKLGIFHAISQTEPQLLAFPQQMGPKQPVQFQLWPCKVEKSTDTLGNDIDIDTAKLAEASLKQTFI